MHFSHPLNKTSERSIHSTVNDNAGFVAYEAVNFKTADFYLFICFGISLFRTFLLNLDLKIGIGYDSGLVTQKKNISTKSQEQHEE